MADLGGPWRAGERAVFHSVAGRRPAGRASVEAIVSDRMLGRVVYAYVVAVVAAVVMTLIGLHEGWW